ncbi:MAG TPA: phospholipase D-like domain-containing protein, partial [Planctomycetota bacterium]|nr:phospholipase D-like domain-containing protein [Planctomycetota bacterium]
MRTVLTVAAVLTVVAISGAAALHALLHKRDSRSALGWVAFCVLFPVVGGFVYWLLGSNRVNTRARKLRGRFGAQPSGPRDPGADQLTTVFSVVPADLARMCHIATVGDRVTRRPLLRGNAVEPLVCGEQAYPAMLAAIDSAEHSVHLLTYLFDGKRTRERFVGALARARERGVRVRVLLDGVGELYGFPRAGKLLQRRGVEVARFLPPSLGSRGIHVNLRNHRKVLVVDGLVGFTGGMNLRDEHEVESTPPRRAVRDLHFRVRGPVVADLERVFLEDWEFATGQRGLEPRVTDPPA